MIDAYSNVPEWGSKFLKDRDHVRYLYYMNWVLHVCVSECVCVRPVTQSCPILCDPINCSLPGSSIRGILLARILEWVAISFSRGSSWPRDWTRVSCLAGGFCSTSHLRSPFLVYLLLFVVAIVVFAGLFHKPEKNRHFTHTKKFQKYIWCT